MAKTTAKKSPAKKLKKLVAKKSAKKLVAKKAISKGARKPVAKKARVLSKARLGKIHGSDFNDKK